LRKLYRYHNFCSDDDPDSGMQIGINYFRQPAELKGCINDARNIERFLTSQLVYAPLFILQ